ncbi:Mycobacterium numidiamassiliense ORFan [Mycobacterium numidiamassiliense]|uniref:Mycobacterium numidiamassiliense ORFan n=1 Tax=Mycobacterium numidiamassiliense TaxID=1841861 RepID=A0A2U3PIU8_9MYCO|nr:hypothetical protein [Mycobacterium numidiamassiliense]SPM43595.1 Mycobacterium numidiamassiliense ORFan [Mycobacterium numidiamassiliense]
MTHATERPKLWIGTALTPYGNEFGAVVVTAETREEAIAAATAKLSQPGNYVPYQEYAHALIANLDNIREVTDGVYIDWDANRPFR